MVQDKRVMRKVVEMTAGDIRGIYLFRLECGHTAYRYYSNIKKAPHKVVCDVCTVQTLRKSEGEE